MSWFELPPEVRGEGPAALGAFIGAAMLKAGFIRKVGYFFMGYGLAKVLGPGLASGNDTWLNVIVCCSAIFGLKIVEGIFDAVSQFDWKTLIADVKNAVVKRIGG